MKVTGKTATQFRVEFNVVVESEAELVGLWAALNSSMSTLRKNAYGFSEMQQYLDQDGASPVEFWKAVDKEIRALNLNN